jgi:putative chitinase
MTLEQLSRFLNSVPRAKLFYPHLVKYMQQYEINTPKRVRAFLAQAAHESWGFTSLIESTNYKSVESLMKTWPKRFPTVKFTEPFVGQPLKVANYVYANRMGNNDEASGDGYRYRGRGIFQLTGKDRYREFGLDTIHDPKIYKQSRANRHRRVCSSICMLVLED